MRKITLCLATLTILCSTAFSQETYKKDDSREIIRKGIELNDDKKYSEAIAEFKKVHRNDSNYVLASVELANTYLANDQDSLAISLCNELLKQKNDYTPNALLYKANAYDNLKKYDESEKIYKQGAKEYPLNCSFLYELGLSKFRQEKYFEANNLFIEAIRINPAYAPNHFQMGNLALIQGKYIPAMMAYQFYLICDNDSKRAMKVINIMESLSKVEINTDSIITISQLANDNDFSELESIFKSKVALSAKYKSKTDMGYDVVKQMQLLTENIGKYKDVSGFYNEFYGKFLGDVWSKGYFEPYAYFSFSGIDNEAVKKIVEKNKKDIEGFKDWAYNYICTNKMVYAENLNGTTASVPHWFASSKVVAAGLKNSKHNNEGYWNFYFENGIKKSEGAFADGKKEGLWKFYFKTGDIKEEITYKNGEQVRYKEFYFNNNPKVEYNLKGTAVDGKATVYYSNGRPKAIYDYVDDKINGTEKAFYRNGSDKYTVKNISGSIEGPYTEYFDNGKMSSQYTFVKGKREGPGKDFYNNQANTLYSEGLYKDNNATGPWKFYYKNGKVSSEGTFKDGEKDGVWKSYYDTGVLESEQVYSNGKRDGVDKSYNEDGTLWEEFVYKKDKLIEYKAYKNNGEVITDDKLNGKNYAVTLYYSNGKKRKTGLITDGDLDGTWKYYSKYNVLEKEENYSKGKLNGKTIDYFMDGSKYVERNYVNGVEDGAYHAYYINGKLKKEGYMVDGNEEGYWKSYYIDGTLEEVDYYHNGDIEGWLEYRDETGKLISEDFYQLGCITQVIDYDTLGNITSNIRLPGGTGVLERKFADGKTLFHKEFLYDYPEGKSITYFPNGQVESERTYKNGRAVDKQTAYNIFGKLISESVYFNGMRNGVSTDYTYDGKKESDYNYVNDNKEGKSYTYYPNGKVFRDFDYKDDDLHGESRVFDEFGQLVFQRHYENDLLTSYTYNGPDGNLLPYKKLESGDMKVVCYFANGKKSFEATYTNGELNGKRVMYNSNGKVSLEDNFVYGTANGPDKEYYANGNLKSVQNYVYGFETGVSKEYYENGNIRSESTYVNGKLHGPSRLYDENGKLITTVNYYHDIAMSLKK